MILCFEDRPAESPFVERIWRSWSGDDSDFVSVAFSNWEMVVWTQHGKTYIEVRGPETKARPAPVPGEAEFFGIMFKHGTFMPHLPVGKLVDNQITLPEAMGQSFWLNGATWQFPNYENADTFVDWLARDGLLVREPLVEATLQGQLKDVSLRTVQRRFLRATGLTQGAVYQIERARHATTLLQQGVTILDTVHEAGYFDQPHLTRALKHYIGQTPLQIIEKTEQLSFLYNTVPAE